MEHKVCRHEDTIVSGKRPPVRCRATHTRVGQSKYTKGMNFRV